MIGKQWVNFRLQTTAASGNICTSLKEVLFGLTPYIYTGCSKKTDPLIYFDDNFSKCGPILTISSLLQQEIHDAQKLSYYSHLTFIMLPLYLAKQTLMLVSMQIFVYHATKQISMHSNG